MNLYTKIRIKNSIKHIIERRYNIALINIFKKERYYIIRRKTPWAGFFANYLFVACHIKYAIDHGYIPVIDMKNFPTLYSEEYPVAGIDNSWEYFFEQPNNNHIEEAYNSRNYILSDSSNYLDYLPYREGYGFFDFNPEKSKQFLNTYCSFIPIKAKVLDELDCESKLLKGCVLGVHVRGTDKREAVVDHHISASVLTYIQATREMLKNYKIDMIYLCCDESSTVGLFRKEFGNLVFTTEAYRAAADSHVGIHLEAESNSREHHKYKLGYEVLRDCYLLSKCDYLIFGHSNVTNTALIWNDGNYKNTKFIENDLY